MNPHDCVRLRHILPCAIGSSRVRGLIHPAACVQWSGQRATLSGITFAPTQRVELVRPPLHHADALVPELGACICPTYRILVLVGKLAFDGIRVCHNPLSFNSDEAVTRKPCAVASSCK